MRQRGAIRFVESRGSDRSTSFTESVTGPTVSFLQKADSPSPLNSLTSYPGLEGKERLISSVSRTSWVNSCHKGTRPNERQWRSEEWSARNREKARPSVSHGRSRWSCRRYCSWWSCQKGAVCIPLLIVPRQINRVGAPRRNAGERFADAVHSRSRETEAFE